MYSRIRRGENEEAIKHQETIRNISNCKLKM